jgi:hypothetical protein
MKPGSGASGKPAAYTTIDTIDPSGSGGNGHVAYKILDAADIASGTVGVFTNAENIECSVYRGVDPAFPIGNHVVGNPPGVVEIPAIGLGLTRIDGTSWVVGFYARELATNVHDKVISDMVNRGAGHATLNMWAGDTGGGVSAFTGEAATTGPNSSGNTNAFAIELRSHFPMPPAATPFVWAVIAGALPPGLSLDPGTGEITGTPTQSGRYEATFVVYNNYWSSETWTCEITIAGSLFNIDGDPVEETWNFDFGKFLTRQKAIWHRHQRLYTRPALIRGEHLYYVGAGNQVIQLDRVGSLTPDGYWTSPKLNRKDRHGEYVLRYVSILYESGGVAAVDVLASGNGGITWESGLKSEVTLTASEGSIKRMTQGFNVAGYDIRFKVKLPSTALIRLRGWRAALGLKGHLGKE